MGDTLAYSSALRASSDMASRTSSRTSSSTTPAGISRAIDSLVKQSIPWMSRTWHLRTDSLHAPRF